MTDSELIRRYIEGDKRAFETFYIKYKNAAFKYAVGMLGNYNDAEEVVASSWHRFICNVEKIKSSPKSYLYSVVRTQTYDFLKANNRTTVLDTEIESTDSCDKETQLFEVILALQELPVEQRESLLLHHYGGYTLAEVAEIQASKRESVKSRVRYAMNQLRNKLLKN